MPIDQAAEAYSEIEDDELLIPATEDLLELLPPRGSDTTRRNDLPNGSKAPRASDRRNLSPDSRIGIVDADPQPAEAPAPGRQLRRARRRTRRHDGRAAETFPYVFMKPPRRP